MKRISYVNLFFVFLAIGLAISCSKDEEPCDSVTATYDTTVKTIIAESCAYSGCHDGTGANQFIPVASNDYTTYAGMKASLDAGLFNTRVLVDKNMPPAAFVPPGSPTELTEAQIETLTCWHDAGYPEN